MRVLLIDADSTIPNLALMKLSTWHRAKGDYVELIKLKLPYYPNRKKITHYIDSTGWDNVYCSVIFNGNKDFIRGKNIVFGGTGYSLTTCLPEEVEKCNPDYSLYPENNISYGFITRGCIRNCSFCIVPKKEGNLHQVADIDSIIRHDKVRFLDNNILAYPKCNGILEELVLKNIKCCFYQGLDIRLLNKENSLLLSKLNYFGDYIFAFDDWKYRAVIEEKIPLLSWRKPFQIKFFVYVHPDMELFETVKRVIWLKKKEFLPYIMRDISCWNSEYSDFYTDLAAYCNQPNFLKKMDFETFLEKRHANNILRMINNILLLRSSKQYTGTDYRRKLNGNTQRVVDKREKCTSTQEATTWTR